MEKDNEKKSKERSKVSVGKSLTMRWSHYRNKGNKPASDKCGRMSESLTEFPVALTTSVSMDTMCLDCTDRRLDADESFRGIKNLKKSKHRGKSLDKLVVCTRSDSEKLGTNFSDRGCFRVVPLELRSASAPPSGEGVAPPGALRWDTTGDSPPLPPPLQPVRVQQPVPTMHGKSSETIYASRQEWLTMAKTHRSSLREKLQEDFLSCKICLEPYRRPKALPCLHSFCESCLRDYVRRHTGSRPGYFPCPMCRRDIKVPDGGIEHFQDNFLLSNLSDTLEEEIDTWAEPTHHQWSPPRSLAPPTPLEQELKDHEWYFGKVSRNASEEWLLSTGYPKGSFLLRQGEASPDTFTLSVRDCDELRGYVVKHYKVFAKRMANPQHDYYFITPKRMFKSLPDLVSHYLETADGLCCKLSQVCGKPRSLSWAQDRGLEDDFSTPRDAIHLVKRLGSGQFADVWLGKWNEREVAVKIQRPDTVKMAAFLDEATILKTLDHPNILKLLAVCSGKEPVNLVMEYLLNGRLSLYLREGKGSELKLTQLLWICAQTLDHEILKTLDHPNILKLLAVCSGKEPVNLVMEYLLNGRLSLYLREGKGSELKLTQLLWICAQTLANEILKTLDRPNILKLLAVCSGKEPVNLVMEYLLNGRLSLYLREGKGSELKLTQLLWICAQVADGLAYMEKEKFIHRNLGARNILVGEQNKVKIAGFGMTKCADDPDFNFRRGLKMAIKWMAPEVLLYNKYSTKADVWSFGILMMEVFTHGKEPYDGMGSKEAFEQVQQGYRMPRPPDFCPSEVYDVILSCWSTNPPSRPSADFLNTFLHDWQSPS